MAVGDTANAATPNGPTNGEVNVEGASSTISAVTETVNPKSKSSAKKDREDQENFGVEVSLLVQFDLEGAEREPPSSPLYVHLLGSGSSIRI